MRLVVVLGLFFIPSVAAAESWCAYPLWVHEWGVQAFDGTGVATSPASLPSWFHRRTGSGGSSTTPTRDLPPDSGVRALPVLHFYSAGSLSSPIPIGIEVGFTEGDALAWYPQVDARRSANAANGPAARRARAALVARRTSAGADPQTRPPLGSDPTRQLIWDQLLLTGAPRHSVHRSTTPWVDTLRGFDAMWVDGASESERFVFYEAETRERVQLALSRGATYGPGRRHFVLRNTGAHSVHDVFVTHREGNAVYVFFAPRIPAGRTAGFVLEEHRVPPRRLSALTRGRLRARLVDSAESSPPAEYRWNMDDCVMMRDPAVPVEEAEGHRLYAHEVDAILDVWGATFFDEPGTTITYREDTDYLDAAMPLSIYTDMFNFVLLRRAGLAVWKNTALP